MGPISISNYENHLATSKSQNLLYQSLRSFRNKSWVLGHLGQAVDTGLNLLLIKESEFSFLFSCSDKAYHTSHLPFSQTFYLNDHILYCITMFSGCSNLFMMRLCLRFRCLTKIIFQNITII